MARDKPKHSDWEIFSIERRFYLSKSRPSRFKEACTFGRQTRLLLKSGDFTVSTLKQLQNDADILLMITRTGNEQLNNVYIDNLK